MSEPTPSASSRALRALADAAGESRPRRPGDATDPDIPVAATVVFLRDAPDGVEVLLIERPDRGSFAGAWVFPGGKIEPVDRDRADDSEVATARRAAVREACEETGLAPEIASLVTLSCWDPPPGLPLRIRTWFFVAPAPAGEVVLQPTEAVTAMWARPADVLARHSRDEMTLYPPTWVTLHGLSGHPDAASVIGSARVAGTALFETVARRGGEGPLLLWQEDAEYDAPGDGAPGARHRLEIGTLPWRYTLEAD